MTSKTSNTINPNPTPTHTNLISISDEEDKKHDKEYYLEELYK